MRCLCGRLLVFLACALVAIQAWSDVVVTDFQQREVRLSLPAKRIVALAPHIVENVFSAGAGDKLVGVVTYSNYPEAASKIPVVGTHQSWSLETIAALQPDLILLWGSGSGLNRMNTLARLGVPVYVSEPRKIEDVARTVKDIGLLAGTQELSEAEAERITSAFDSLAEKYRTRQSISVFYQVWNKPLQTVNGEHMISHVLELCGARNAFADAVSLAPKINVESVLHRDPDAIVASGMDEARPEWLDQWLAYPSLSAVQNKALFFVHPDHVQRPTARLVLGATTICRQLDTLRE
jgi:iron complex transport system substrate-binding protein